MAYPAVFPDGKVWHYNLTDNVGTQYHVYINAYGAYEIVPPGGRPGGY
jgi:hypothetical protein